MTSERAALAAFFEDIDADWTNDNIRPGTFAFRFRHAADRLRAALAATPAPRDDGWDELRREIEALPTGIGGRVRTRHVTVSRIAVLAIVDRLALERAGIDVERLARAIDASWAELLAPLGGLPDGVRRSAEAIAAEYDRLAE